jgi:hypothetical protein
MRGNVLLFTFFMLLQACTFREKPAETVLQKTDVSATYNRQIQEGTALLKDGDLLVRNGNDLTSQLIKNFSKKDKSYSHSGLVFFRGETPFVYHILAAEGDVNSELVADSLGTFCDPRHNSAFAIYRYDLDPAEMANLKRAVFNWYEKGVKFDSLFNLKTDGRMYCSEMIKKGLERSTNNRIKIGTIHPNANEAMLAATRIPLSATAIQKLDIVPIDHLYVNPHSRLVKRVEFNPVK